MPCLPIQVNGARGFMCTRGAAPKVKRCKHCGQPATLLCDWPRGSGTCDAPICIRCAVTVDADLHQCQAHSVPGLF